MKRSWLQSPLPKESRSGHPLGKAIAEKAKQDGLSLYDVSDFKMAAGKGIAAKVNGVPCYLGNEKYLLETGVDTENAATVLNKLRSEGKASVIVSEQNRVIGVIALSDVLRPEAKEMVERLSGMGTKSVLLTGDHRTAAEYFAAQVGITEIRADLLPEEKVENNSLLKQTGKVCMIGDGVNDALALKTADVGVAMGAMGSDIAVDAVDVH